MALFDIKKYLDSNCFKPFILYVNNDDYEKIIHDIKSDYSTNILRLSDCCNNDDKKPDLDKLRSNLRELDVDVNSNRYILLGVSEYLSFESLKTAKEFIRELLSFNLGTAKIICVFRYFKNELSDILNSDIRMNRQIKIYGDKLNSFEVQLSIINNSNINGFKALLRTLEDTNISKITANSKLDFPSACLKIEYLKDYKEAIFLTTKIVNRNIENVSFWKKLWEDISDSNSLENVFVKYNFTTEIDEDFFNRISVQDYVSFIYFEYLKQNIDNVKNKYLKNVIKNTDSVQYLKQNILNYICSFNHNETNYWNLYNERKKIIKYFNEQEIASFVNDNRADLYESIYRLTDSFIVEKQEIIAYIAQNHIPKEIDRLYPALALYLEKYYFGSTKNDLFLTNYFEKYKNNKLRNHIDDELQEMVNYNAVDKIFNFWPSKDELIKNIDKNGAFLCWVDALGIEYLSYIIELSKKIGLNCTINVGRSELPTITSINKNFFDDWDNTLKMKVSDLDDIKHHDRGGYRYCPSNLYPIHLASELDVIKKVINDAALELSLKKCKKYIIASDHGASRLAVIAKKEEKYDCGSKGEHSGRCCKSFENYDLTYSTEENGYIILSDYGRFKGSRASNVEVHGGASLEEVLVPIIELSMNDYSVNFRIIQDKIYCDRKNGINFILYVDGYVNDIILLKYNGEEWKGFKIDDSHWRFNVESIKKAGKYKFNIFIGNNLASSIETQVYGKMASIDDGFDDLF